MKTCLKTLQMELEQRAPSDSALFLEMEPTSGGYFLSFRLNSMALRLTWSGEHHDEDQLVEQFKLYYQAKIQDWWENRF